MSNFLPTKNKFISSFDVLPNEILLHIFDYLTSNEIIYSFINCNQRLKCLLLTQKYHFKVPTTNLDFWKKTLPIVGPLIQTLAIHTDHLTVPLDFFSNLTSIIISSPYSLLDGQLQSIVHHQCFQQLQTLKIKDVILSVKSFDTNILDDEQILFRRIFDNDNSLQVFEYLPSLDKLSNRNLNRLNSNIHIRSLILNLTSFYSLDYIDGHRKENYSIFTFIQYTPNLIYLNIQSEMPFVEIGEYELPNINQIRLEKFYFKCKPAILDGYPSNRFTLDINQLFRFIHLFSLSLITLSLDLADVYVPDRSKVLLDGVNLENQLLKPLKQLQNFHIYIKFHGYRDVEQILSTFQTFPWPMGTHRNTYLYSLPFAFHKLKHFHHFQNVQLSNAEILKDAHRLWSKVRSLELVHIDEINFRTLFSLIKMNMPKLSSITFYGNNRDKLLHCDDSDDCNDSGDEIERVNAQLDSVTTIHLCDMSMKQIQQIRIHTFPNLQCLIIDNTELPSKENELISFFSEKLRRIESDAFFSEDHIQGEKDFSSFFNLQHVMLKYDSIYGLKRLNDLSQIIRNSLLKLSKLETLSIYAIPSHDWDDRVVYGPKAIFYHIMDGLDENQIKAQYEIKYSGRYIWFIRNTHVSSSF